MFLTTHCGCNKALQAFHAFDVLRFVEMYAENSALTDCSVTWQLLEVI